MDWGRQHLNLAAEAERDWLRRTWWGLAAGEAVMAGYTGTAFNTYYVLNAIGLLLFAATFLHSPRFKRSIGYWGLASGVLMIVPSSAGLVGMIFSLLSLIPWVVFIALLIGVLKKAAADPTV